MNAHQRYIANLIANLTPANVAQWVAEPPSGRSQQMSATELHALVLEHGDEVVKGAWVELLAEAADPANRDPKWVPQWATPIAAMIFALPAPDEAEVEAHELREVA